ncbi:MAG: cellulase family glycosylhydrolase [Planctomycetes bacterium]|nr:cellulase family glycosylhydrolase [Planctomycetota bacterium]
MVPFVIPAKPNPDSLIAVTSIEPVKTDSNRLQARDGHFYRSGERVRLWGVNLSFGANMPKHEDAPYIAARLAAAGVNSVRCHHMDTARWPRGLWNAEDGKTISPEALDRLDFFIDQLARHGIYVNINLHVGRVHSEYLGLPKANRQYDKISNIFTPALIDAQKQFARQLLIHVNPYRKVRYADDPAVAFVEITNENSFFMWANEETLRTLPPYYADILQKKYNDWLKKRYGSDEKLRRIWSEGAGPLGKNLLSNSNLRMTAPGSSVPKNWNLEQHSGCKASLSQERYQSKTALRIEIDKADDTEWHLQFNQGGISLKAGRYYTVMFEAAADESREISCSVSQAHSTWSNLGLSRQVKLSQKWQIFRFGFVAKSDDDNARLSFAFGTGKVPFYLANVRFHPGGRVSLQKGESIKSGSIAVFADNENPNRAIDRMQFLAETEKAYFDGMRNFIKKDLGCKALVTGTIVFGPLGLYTQSDMDFIDVHAYWQHPRFPGRSWDRGNWIVEQKPMTNYPEEATLFRLAAARLYGKPFTLSEYNHPAPLDSQAECVPMAASFAAAQDWDAIWLYTYSHSSDDWYRENMNSYFDIDTNPAKWGFMRAGAAIFRDGLVQPLEGAMIAQLNRSSDLVRQLAQLHLKHDRDMMDVVVDASGATRQNILGNRLFVGFRPLPDIGDAPSRTSLKWSVENGRGLYYVGSGSGVLSGDTSRFERCQIDDPEFAVITATPLDGLPWPRSSKILITACGRCENVGMEFSKDRRTVGRQWGQGPAQIETVKGTVEMARGNWTAQALGPDGTTKADVPIRSEGNRNFIEMSPKYKTMWYLLEKD